VGVGGPTPEHLIGAGVEESRLEGIVELSHLVDLRGKPPSMGDAVRQDDWDGRIRALSQVGREQMQHSRKEVDQEGLGPIRPDTLVLQGDHRERLPPILSARGVRKIVRGT
jgi:hypothetical protein